MRKKKIVSLAGGNATPFQRTLSSAQSLGPATWNCGEGRWRPEVASSGALSFSVKGHSCMPGALPQGLVSILPSWITPIDCFPQLARISEHSSQRQSGIPSHHSVQDGLDFQSFYMRKTYFQIVRTLCFFIHRYFAYFCLFAFPGGLWGNMRYQGIKSRVTICYYLFIIFTVFMDRSPHCFPGGSNILGLGLGSFRVRGWIGLGLGLNEGMVYYGWIRNNFEGGLELELS